MNIIIPIGGKGERFKNKGYNISKPLIKIFYKEMIFYLLDNLNININDKIFIIYYNLEKYDFEKTILNKHPYINFIRLNKQTNGASETIMYGLEEILKITNNNKCMLFDCDTFYTQDVIDIYKYKTSNAVFYTINKEINPLFSYIKLDDNKNIIKIIEKVKISDYANTGIYCFENINELYYFSSKVVNNNINFKGETYISCIIDQMIQDNKIFEGIELNDKFVFNLGTPEQLENYIKNTYLFLFDLDGTLVLTDDIYYNVWSNILKEYNIEITNEIFKNYIQGNSDNIVLKTLLPSKYDELLDDISNIKDTLFLKNISNIKIIDGSIDFIKKIKKNGHKIAIVTNCNETVANEIIKFINIDKLIDNSLLLTQ